MIDSLKRKLFANLNQLPKNAQPGTKTASELIDEFIERFTRNKKTVLNIPIEQLRFKTAQATDHTAEPTVLDRHPSDNISTISPVSPPSKRRQTSDDKSVRSNSFASSASEQDTSTSAQVPPTSSLRGAAGDVATQENQNGKHPSPQKALQLQPVIEQYHQRKGWFKKLAGHKKIPAVFKRFASTGFIKDLENLLAKKSIVTTNDIMTACKNKDTRVQQRFWIRRKMSSSRIDNYATFFEPSVNNTKLPNKNLSATDKALHELRKQANPSP